MLHFQDPGARGPPQHRRCAGSVAALAQNYAPMAQLATPPPALKLGCVLDGGREGRRGWHGGSGWWLRADSTGRTRADVGDGLAGGSLLPGTLLLIRNFPHLVSSLNILEGAYVCTRVLTVWGQNGSVRAGCDDERDGGARGDAHVGLPWRQRGSFWFSSPSSIVVSRSVSISLSLSPSLPLSLSPLSLSPSHPLALSRLPSRSPSIFL